LIPGNALVFIAVKKTAIRTNNTTIKIQVDNIVFVIGNQATVNPSITSHFELGICGPTCAVVACTFVS
jgi:hypothetical protein